MSCRQFGTLVSVVIEPIACPAEGRTYGAVTNADARSAAPVLRGRLGNTGFRFKINCNLACGEGRRECNSCVFQVSVLLEHEAESLGYWISDVTRYGPESPGTQSDNKHYSMLILSIMF